MTWLLAMARQVPFIQSPPQPSSVWHDDMIRCQSRLVARVHYGLTLGIVTSNRTLDPSAILYGIRCTSGEMPFVAWLSRKGRYRIASEDDRPRARKAPDGG